MVQISALLDFLPTSKKPLTLPKEVTYIKVSAKESEILQWFNWGKHYHERPIIFSIPDTTETKRADYLIKAAEIFDFIELDAATDITFYKEIPANKRVIRLEKVVYSLEELSKCFEKIQIFNAVHYEIITKPNKAADLLIPILFQKIHAPKKLTVYAGGFSGMWTQILNAYLGAKMVFGSINNNIESHFSIQRLLGDYQLPYIKPIKEIYGIIGNPVLRSLSPKIHNSAYNELNIAALYLPFHVENFADFWYGVIKNKAFNQLDISINGLTCVSPFKAKGIQYVEYTSNPLIRLAKAGNLLMKIKNKWVGSTTDSLGVLHGLKKFNVNINSLNVAIIGCGGAGRTIAIALKKAGAKVTLVNRSLERGSYAAHILSLPFLLLSDFKPRNYNLLVNATPVGKKHGSIPFDTKELQSNSIIIDMVYRIESTLLIQRAKEMGLRTIDGFEILGKQVQFQFMGMTNQDMPESMAYQLARPERNLITS